MGRAMKWAAGIGAGVVGLSALAVFALSRWAASEDFRARAQQQASQALGVPVQLGRLDIALWPPSVAVHDVRVQTRPAVTLQRVEAQPVWTSLLAGRAELGSLTVRNAVLPQQGIAAVVAGLQKQEAAAGKSAGAGTAPSLPRRIVLDRVTWVDAKAQKLTVDAEIRFEGELLPAHARVDVVEGRYAGMRAKLDRQPDAWQLRGEAGGGTITGPLRLQALSGGAWRLTGELATQGVEVAALTVPSRTLTGKLEARTTLQSDFKDPGAIADTLRTQTRFTVRNAVLHGIDLAAAVRTLGVSRDGQTAFDTLQGQVATQGKVVNLTNLVANSGMLAANGNVTLAADRTLNGKVNAALTAGAIGQIAGVPLQVGGTLDNPSVTPTGVALPGSGVASDIGNSIRGLFGR